MHMHTALLLLNQPPFSMPAFMLAHSAAINQHHLLLAVMTQSAVTPVTATQIATQVACDGTLTLHPQEILHANEDHSTSTAY